VEVVDGTPLLQGVGYGMNYQNVDLTTSQPYQNQYANPGQQDVILGMQPYQNQIQPYQHQIGDPNQQLQISLQNGGMSPMDMQAMGMQPMGMQPMGIVDNANANIARAVLEKGMQPVAGPTALANKNLFPEASPTANILQEDDGDQEKDDEFKPITDIPVPEFLNVFAALSGLSDLSYWIAQQRELRNSEMWQNPYMEVEELVVSLSFEMLVAGVIVLNCFLIGWEASIPDGEMAGLFNVCEHFFTLFFLVEWILRIIAFGKVWIFEPANAADTALALGTGVVVKWMAEPAGIDLGNFRILTVLRGFRLVRLARSVRLIPFFSDLWVLIRGLTTSARPLLWTLVIVMSVLYIFAIAATEFIGKSPSFADDEKAQLMFGDFMRSMFTMVQLITLDTYCDDVIRPMMQVEPWLAFFFVFFITVGVFIVMNLVTAIIVENANCIKKEDTESEAKEAEQKKKDDLKLLSQLFMEIDLDGSGELSREEFFSSLKNKKVKQMLDIMEMKVVELEEVWEVLDDGDGLLTIKEFTDGIRRMKGEAKAKDVADVIKKLKVTDRKHRELKDQAARYRNTLQGLENDAREMARDTEEIVDLFKEMYHRLASHIKKGEKEDLFHRRENEKLEKLAEGVALEEDGDEEDDDDEEEAME
jgi:hypothetical protein